MPKPRIIHDERSYPLHWPVGWPRTKTMRNAVYKELGGA
jgi:hypothetical protein